MARHMLGRVPATAAAPRQEGALLSAAVLGDTSTDAWLDGVYAWPDAVPAWRVREACGPGLVDYGHGEVDTLPVGAVPFDIQTRTSMRTNDLDELRERARMQIEAVTPLAVARELWTGELTRQAPWQSPRTDTFTLANPRADSGTGSDGPWLNPHLHAAEMLAPEDDPAAAVGAVESAAGRLITGPVTIHVPTELVLSLSQFGITPQGDRLYTPLGSLVISDAGYPGTTLDGTGTAVYATGPVQVWLGAPAVAGSDVEVVNPRTNELSVWATRAALALFDTQTLVGCALTTT